MTTSQRSVNLEGPVSEGRCWRGGELSKNVTQGPSAPRGPEAQTSLSCLAPDAGACSLLCLSEKPVLPTGVSEASTKHIITYIYSFHKTNNICTLKVKKSP